MADATLTRRREDATLDEVAPGSFATHGTLEAEPLAAPANGEQECSSQ